MGAVQCSSNSCTTLIISTVLFVCICLVYIQINKEGNQSLTLTTAKLPESTPKSMNKLKYEATHVIRDCQIKIDDGKFYSQYREDFALFSNYFAMPPICNGVYVELGAFDGVSLGNTKFFEDTLHWSGVLIEANPSEAAKLSKTRPKNALFKEAICPPGQHNVSFVKGRAVGGIPEFLRESIISYFFHGNISDRVTVPCRPLNEILKVAKIKAIDLFSLDVEGAELMVLETMDWTIPVKLFAVEMGSRDEDVRHLLAKHGYRRTTWNIRGFCRRKQSCTNNEVFENPEYVYT